MTAAKTTIGIALPYAVSIRDLITSGALQELLDKADIHIIIYTLNPELREFARFDRNKVTVRPIKPYHDGFLERSLKRLYPMFFADMLGHVQISLRNRPVPSAVSALCIRLRQLVGTRRLLRVISAVLLVLYKARREQSQLHDCLSLFIGTRSLINSLDYGLLAEATTRRIPTLTIAGSWDNFTTKGFFPFPSKRTIVWNEKMRDELITLFDVHPESITLAGYPRAHLLRDSVLETTPEEYLRTLGITGFRKFILYSASYGNFTRVPDRPVPLEYELIKNTAQRLVTSLPDDVCILIRMHPFSDAPDKQFFARMPRCFVYVPGRSDVYVERVMDRSDEAHLATQIAKAECVITMASTMSIDVLCLGRPVLNIDFDPFEDLPELQSLRRFYHFTHFRDLIMITKIPLARTFEDVWDFVHASLTGCYKSPTDLAAFERMYVPADSYLYPKVVRSTVEELLAV